MSRNQIIIGLVSLIVLFIFLFVAYTLTNKPENLLFPEVTKILPSDHVKWAKDKKNILVEYSDLQCPACKSFHDIIKSEIETDKSITSKVTLVYRHFPLYQTHPYAEKAAFAAEAAAMQNKFFEYTDKLFLNQENWSTGKDIDKKFDMYASELKLDIQKFKKDINSQTVKNKVQADAASGDKFQVNATPTFYLNGEKLNSVRSFEEFVQLLKSL